MGRGAGLWAAGLTTVMAWAAHAATAWAGPDPIWVETQKLQGWPSAFGEAIAIENGTAVISAPNGADYGIGGAVHVYARTGSTWTKQQMLDVGDGYFGDGLALSGDTLLVGASYDSQQGTFAGAAYVYTRAGNTWSLQQKILPSIGQPYAYFGATVAIRGDTAIVGMDYGDLLGENSGMVFAYERTGSTWVETQVLSPAGGYTWEWFGQSVALNGSGDIAFIGAPGRDDGQPDAGAVYVYARTGGTWVEKQKLLASDPGSPARFGRALAVSGGTLVIGAYNDDDNGEYSGSVYVFEQVGDTWVEKQKLVPANGVPKMWFGHSVAISGTTIVAGAPAAGTGSGYVFSLVGDTWVEKQKLLASDGAAGNYFGWAAAIEGDMAIFGAKNSGNGAAYGFRTAADQGAGCATSTDCASGFCAGGVCCDTACDGPCEACSVAAGAPKDGVCAPLTGTACDDGDACTQSSVCKAGVCVGSDPVTCPPTACQEAGTCDPENGTCSSHPVPDGTACDGGTCAGGQCIPQNDTTSSGTTSSGTSSGGSDGGASGDGGAGGGGTAGPVRGCGCSLVGNSPAPSGAWLGLGLILLARRGRGGQRAVGKGDDGVPWRRRTTHATQAPARSIDLAPTVHGSLARRPERMGGGVPRRPRGRRGHG